MRYPQGGGLTAERRAFREHIRMQAAELFALGDDNAAVAKQLRVSARSVQRWHQAWEQGGTSALESKGPASRPKLSEALFEVLEQELAKGPVTHGWPDQTWTLARIKTAETVESPLPSNRHGGFGERSGETDREQSQHRAPGLLSDEAGFSMTPPTARTWARRGHTPVIRVRGRSQRRFSIAALACYKQGERSRLIYRPKRHVDHKRGGRRSFTWTDYRDLLVAAHQQLDAPIVLVWDNLNVHKDARLQAFIDAHDWITCYFLPAYAPDLNPVEGIWSLLRRSSQTNTAFADPDHLMRALRQGLREIQYRSNLVDGCLAETGLTLTTSRQQGQ